MTSTLDHRKSAPLPLGGVMIETDDDVESLGSSVPEFIELRVILPDGSEKTTSVSSSKQMLDLAVWLSATNRLSPSDHTLAVYHPEHGRPVNYKASQMIGALRVDTVHLVNKKANRDKGKRHTVAQPFEMTNRVSVNLPKNQKTVIRISPNSTLADIFKMVCTEKGLDPYKHELRHPTRPDMALNMASPLSVYNIVDISVVNVTAPDQQPNTGGTVKSSIYDTHWSYNSMPRNKSEQAEPPSGGGEQQQSSYMPGMTEKKKKKGLMSIFSRKKEGKFRLSDTTFNAPSTSSQPHTYDPPPPVVTNGNKPQAEVRPQPQHVPLPMTSIHAETSTSSLKSATAEPKKPQRKKRQAPAPPGVPSSTKPLSVETETSPRNNKSHGESHGVHSRGSSNSSGFDENTNLSPLESPGGSSGKSSSNNTAGSGTQAGSSNSSGIMGNGRVHAEPVIKVSSTEDGGVSTTNVSRHSSMSTGANSSTSSLTRGRKKRMAPAPPPPGGSKPTSATTSPSHSATSRSDDSSTRHSPQVAPPSDEGLDVRELQMAIAEELKNEETFPIKPAKHPAMKPKVVIPSGRPCQFIPPPPPESSPPPMTPGREPDSAKYDFLYRGVRGSDIEVMDISTQVHATQRDSLCSEVSSCDTVTDSEEVDAPRVDPNQPALIQDSSVRSSGREPIQRQKSDVAVFVEQMAELTDNVQRDSKDDGDVHIVASSPEPEQQQVHEPPHVNIRRPPPDLSKVEIHATPDDLKAKKLSVASDSSSDVGSLSKFKFDHESDSESEESSHDRTMSPAVEDEVVPQKKKVVPAFKLEFGEDDVLGENLSDPQEGHKVKLFDVNAVMNAFDKIEEVEEDSDSKERDDSGIPQIDTDVVYAAQHEHDAPHVTTINIGDDDFQNNETDDWVHSEWVPLEDQPSENQRPPTSSSQESKDWVHSGWITVEDKPEEKPRTQSPEQPESAEWVHSEWIVDNTTSATENELHRDEIKLDHNEATYVDPRATSPVPHVPLDEVEHHRLHMHDAAKDKHETVHMQHRSASPATHSHLHLDEVEHHRLHLHEDTKESFANPLEEKKELMTVYQPSTPPSGSPRLDAKVKVSPPRTSLYSIIKSSKAEGKKGVSPPEPVRAVSPVRQEKFAVADVPPKVDVEDIVRTGTPRLHTEPEPEPKVVQQKMEPVVKEEPQPKRDKSPQPVFTSLRDAYRNKQSKEPETLIIRKPEPYKIPDVTKRDHKPEIKASVQPEELKTSLGDKGSKPGTDHNQNQPIAYNTASLAVSRKAKVKPHDVEDSSEPVFWGPRPWSARTSETPNETTQTETAVKKGNIPQTTPKKERPHSVIGMYSPGKSPSTTDGSPKDKCSEISFSPKSEEEDGHHIHDMMENKSIAMLAHPVERKSILKSHTAQESPKENRKYYSAVNLSSSANDAELKAKKDVHVDNRMYSSSSSLLETGKDPNQNAEIAIVKPIIKQMAKVPPKVPVDTKAKAQRNLQQQYFDLQNQFSKWQRQLVDNQALMTQKNVASVEPMEQEKLSKTDVVDYDQMELTNEGTGSVLRKQMSLDAIEQQRAAESYRRLNTPRPFMHKSSEPMNLVSKPIMKKRFSYDERRQVSDGPSFPTKDTTSGIGDSSSHHANVTSADLTAAKGGLKQNSQTEPVDRSTSLTSVGHSQIMRLTSVDSRIKEAAEEVPDIIDEEVVHRTLVQSKSEPIKITPQPPPAPVLNKNSLNSSSGNVKRTTKSSRDDPRFGPRLDPREELMIAIRNAEGGKKLNKSSSVEADW